MIFGRFSLLICLVAASLATGGRLVCDAQPTSPGRGKRIEFSAPKRDGTGTNWNQLMKRPEGLKQLEEEVYRSGRPMSPESSLDGEIALPNRPSANSAIQNKRLKELMDRRKNWVFMTPEDFFGTPSAEGNLKSPSFRPDGKDAKDGPLLERYYDRVTRGRSEANNPAQARDEESYAAPSRSNPRDETSGQDDSDLPSNIKERAESLKKMLGTTGNDNPFVPEATHGTLSDIFGLGEKTLTKDQIQDHKKYLDEYHSVLDPAWHPPAVAGLGNPLDNLGSLVAPVARPTPALPSVSSPVLNRGFDSPASVLNPVLGPPGLADVNAQAFGHSMPAAALPVTQPTRATPVIPSFEAPRRAFR
jgi:hypothetical protein